MASSLAQQLVKRLRRRGPDPVVPRADNLPKTPTVGQLTEAAAAAASGRADCERYALLLLAVDADPAAGELAQLAEELLTSAETSVWRQLDLATRWSWWRAPIWAESTGSRLASGQPSLLSLVLASFHPSGYVRESAVARLGEVAGPLSQRALAVRTGDWVPQVRNRARTAIEQQLSSADGLLAVGALAEAIAGQLHGRWLADRFETAAATLGDADLARLRAAPDRRLRRAAYRVSLAERRLGIEELVEIAEHDADLVVRVRCADAAIRAASATGELGRVRPLADGGTAAVRAAAVAAFAQAGDVAVVLAALPDRNPAVREGAQAAARRAGIDPAVHYRELVQASEPPDPAAVAGLGETGTGGDAELVRPALAHPLPRGRVAAVRALRRLGATDLDMLLRMLQDPAPAVTRQAVLSLRPRAAEVPLARLEPLLDPASMPHVRTAAYRVLREHDVWTRLCVDLELYDDADQGLRNRARNDVAGWLSREAATTYSMPTGDTADRLEHHLVRLTGTLESGRERLLRFHLGLPAGERLR